jgi:hypothetical protein
VATDARLPSGSQIAKILRATIRDDELWSDVSPAWDADEVVEMTSFRGALLVATKTGGLWRMNARDEWSQLDPGSTTSPLRSVAMLRTPDGNLVCIARGSLRVRCNRFPEVIGWQPFPVPGELATDTTIDSAQLRGLGGRLYIGVGGASAGSRDCAVWVSSVAAASTPARWGAAWTPLTTDCFGRGSDPAVGVVGNTWVTSMAAFDGEMYVGTGGHHPDGTGVYNTTGSGFADVTPPTIGLPIPRYGAMAVAGTRLFVGNHIGSPGFGTQVFAGLRDGSWVASNEPGFSMPENLSTSALASRDAYLYAGTLNLVHGFEVWARVPPLLEFIPPIERYYRILPREVAGLRVCVQVPLPCPIDLRPVYEPFEEIRLAFDKAQHPEDDANVIGNARTLIARAAGELERADQLAKLLGIANSAKEKREMGRELMLHVNEGVKLTGMATHLVQPTSKTLTIK